MHTIHTITSAGIELLNKAMSLTLEDLSEEVQREVATREAYHGDRLAHGRAVEKARIECIEAALQEITSYKEM